MKAYPEIKDTEQILAEADELLRSPLPLGCCSVRICGNPSSSTI
jgi:hypothetical protein